MKNERKRPVTLLVAVLLSVVAFATTASAYYNMYNVHTGEYMGRYYDPSNMSEEYQGDLYIYPDSGPPPVTRKKNEN
jgi:hypothetical protein